MALTLLTANASDEGASASVTTASSGESDASTGEFNYSADEINVLVSTRQELRAADRARTHLLLDASSDPDWDNKPIEEKYDALNEASIAAHQVKAAAMSKALSALQSGPSATTQITLALFGVSEADTQVSILTTGQVGSTKLTDGNDVLSIMAQSVSDVDTFAGNDAIAIQAESVEGVHTGDGNDAVAIDAGWVNTVGLGAGNDAVAINADIVDSVYTGAGSDAVAINSELADSIYTDTGDDSLSLRSALVQNVYAGSGNDNVSITAVMGGQVLNNLGEIGDVFFGNDLTYERPDTVDDRLRLAATLHADVDGGAGNDTISVNVQEMLTVDGGTGDDLIVVERGTVAVQVGGNSGDDTIRVAEGVELLIQLDNRAGYDLTEDGDDLIVTHDGGTVRIENYQNAAAIAIAGSSSLSSFVGTGTAEGAAVANLSLADTYFADAASQNGSIVALTMAENASVEIAENPYASASSEAESGFDYSSNGDLNMVYRSGAGLNTSM